MEITKWCITGKYLTKEEQYIINAYIRSIPGGEHYTDKVNHIKRYYVFVENNKYRTSRDFKPLDLDFAEITFEQFKKYILKEETESSNILTQCL
jgi:hypothetical protein